MPKNRIGNIYYHTFESFNEYGINHAMVARHGGVSPQPWASLNIGSTVGDMQEHVEENLERFLDAFAIDRESLFDVWQVHSDKVVNAVAYRKPNEPHEKADAILTDREGLAILMRFADCVPILLFDPEKKVVGITHAGWKGTVKKAVTKAVLGMIKDYGSQPGNIIAGIGPSIAGHHYEVGQEVKKQAIKAFEDTAPEILSSKDGSTYFDLWRANQLLLEEAGVSKIEILGICTACNTEDWYSHRAENGQSGRFGVFIRL